MSLGWISSTEPIAFGAAIHVDDRQPSEAQARPRVGELAAAVGAAVAEPWERITDTLRFTRPQTPG